MAGAAPITAPAFFNCTTMIDPKFTKKIQDWLYVEPKTDDMAVTGAMLLQQINPRNFAYRRWLSMAGTRPKSIISKIEYELKKHLRYRLDGLTLEQVRRLDQNVVPEAKKIIEKGVPKDQAASEADGATKDAQQEVKLLGKRADHDQLPDEIKKLWDDNGKLYKDIKATFEELKSMENLPSCDRYDKLQLLASLDSKYLKLMEVYDNYVIGKETADETGNSETTKNVGTARAYISKNLDNLAQLKSASEAETSTDADKETYQALLAKMQQRLDVIKEAKAPITEEMLAKYKYLGLTTDEDTNDKDGTEAAE